ncbi:MAG: hypothetical protein WDA74_10045 [Spirochaetota bacterium]
MRSTYTLLILLLIITGCSKKESIQFCEGVDNNGKGVACGKKFTTGDLTAVILKNETEANNLISIKVINTSGNVETVINTFNVEVEEGKPAISFNLPFYNAGTFRVEAFSNDKKTAEGTIEIIDTY